jgi:hypothetical protein
MEMSHRFLHKSPSQILQNIRDPLLFWKGYDLTGSALELSLPFAVCWEQKRKSEFLKLSSSTAKKHYHPSLSSFQGQRTACSFRRKVFRRQIRRELPGTPTARRLRRLQPRSISAPPDFIGSFAECTFPLPPLRFCSLFSALLACQID